MHVSGLFSFLPSPRPAATNLLSVCLHLLILDASCKWSHTAPELPCPASFAEHRVFKVLSWRSGMHQYLTPFMAEQYSIVWMLYILYIRSPADGHLASTFWLS